MGLALHGAHRLVQQAMATRPQREVAVAFEVRGRGRVRVRVRSRGRVREVQR